MGTVCYHQIINQSSWGESVTLEGGYAPGFTVRTGASRGIGALIITCGTLVAEEAYEAAVSFEKLLQHLHLIPHPLQVPDNILDMIVPPGLQLHQYLGLADGERL